MTKEWLTSCQQELDEALRKLAADESESVIIDTLTKIHGISETAFRNCLAESPTVSFEVKQRIRGRVNFPDLIDWMTEFCPHAMSEQVAEEFREFNERRNKAVHPKRDPRPGEPLFDIPSSDYVKSIGILVGDILQSLSIPMPPQPEPRPPEMIRTGEPSEPWQKARFPGQLKDEEVVINKGRHWFTIIKWIGGRPPLLLFISLVIAWIVTAILDPSPGTRLAYWLVILAPALIWIVWRVLDWGNERYIVTNKRVISREKVYFLFESQREAYLDKIQDVTIEIVNPFANVLNFGDVIIETAGAGGAIEFQAISRPGDVQRLILESAGLPAKEEELPPQPQFRLLWRGLWRMLYPTYPTEEEDPIVWGKHWWGLLGDLILPVMAMFALATIWLWALTSLSYPGWVNVLFALGLTVIAIWIAFKTIDWHNDLYILTKDRVIDIEKKPFIFEHRREANLDTIQDVSFEQPSFIAKLLDFGNVILQTAGKAGEFTFDNVPHPEKVQATIIERLNAFRQKQEQEKSEKQRAEIISMVEEYLRRAGTNNR